MPIISDNSSNQDPDTTFSKFKNSFSNIKKKWQLLNNPQKFAVVTVLLLAVTLPTSVATVFQSTENRSSAAAPATPPIITPTPQPISYLSNGSFETDTNNDGLPDLWTSKNLGQGDTLVTNIVYDGLKSFNFSPLSTPTSPKEQLFQNLVKNGNANETISVDVYSQSDKNISQGKAGVILTVYYSNKTGDVDTASGVFPLGAHIWTKKTVGVKTVRPYIKIQTKFFNTNRNSQVRIDKASLTIVGGAAAQGTQQTPNELTTGEIQGLQ